MFGDLSRLNKRAKQLLEKNLAYTKDKWICPSWPHYKNKALWDSCFQAMVCHELGMDDLAKKELEVLFECQSVDGFIPHEIYLSQTIPPIINERNFYLDGTRCSSYTLSPVIAQAFEYIGDADFTDAYFDKILNFYTYFIRQRDPDRDNLISIVHPHECGRDSSPEFDGFLRIKPFPARCFEMGLGHMLAVFRLDLDYRMVGWQPDEMFKLGHFDVEDVMMNCLWVQGMRSLERMARHKGKKTMIRQLANLVEMTILCRMWDEEEKRFCSLNSENQPLKNISISSLFPIILETIPYQMVEAIVSLITNKNQFGTEWPLSTVSVSSPKFSPGGNTTSCSWRGANWINMDWFIIAGLIKQARSFHEARYMNIARKIARKNLEMVDREGFWEFYNPFTGKGLRVKDFAWSTLVVTYPRLFASPLF